MLKSKKKINGILLFDKDVGQSSNQALQKIKSIFGAQKAGHTGTLDVLASGLLPICFGESTKVSQYLLGARKTYLAEFRFGLTTSSGDLEGEVLTTESVDSLSKEMISGALSKFVGPLEQVPPMYSALKQKGVPLYRLARQGISVERQPRKIEIYRFELKTLSGNSATFEIDCSKGTYVRQLAADLGDELGFGACVSSLRRERLGGFDVKNAYTIRALEKAAERHGALGLVRLLLSSDNALAELPSKSLSAEESLKLGKGQQVADVTGHPLGLIRLYDEKGMFFGVGERLADGCLRTRRLIRGA